MIPKIIHYCWLGKTKKPKMFYRCLKSWKEHCVDYEIKEWNESNYNIYQNNFAVQAYKNKKWAFVSDFIRASILFKYGGIYLDTDVEILKTLDPLLENDSFLGFETKNYISTAIIGCNKGNTLIGELLEYYKCVNFQDKTGSLNLKTNVQLLTELLEKYGLKRDNTMQIVNNVKIYPKEYLSPFDDPTGILSKTEKTYSIHWFNKSWINPWLRARTSFTKPLHRYFGYECFQFFKKK